MLITRFYPRGVKLEKYDVWVRPLAPGAELLKRYKNTEINWDDFKTALLSELRENMDGGGNLCTTYKKHTAKHNLALL